MIGGQHLGLKIVCAGQEIGLALLDLNRRAATTIFQYGDFLFEGQTFRPCHGHERHPYQNACRDGAGSMSFHRIAVPLAVDFLPHCRARVAGSYLASARTLPEIVIGSPCLRSLILLTNQQCGMWFVRPSGLR